MDEEPYGDHLREFTITYVSCRRTRTLTRGPLFQHLTRLITLSSFEQRTWHTKWLWLVEFLLLLHLKKDETHTGPVERKKKNVWSTHEYPYLIGSNKVN